MDVVPFLGHKLCGWGLDFASSSSSSSSMKEGKEGKEEEVFCSMKEEDGGGGKEEKQEKGPEPEDGAQAGGSSSPLSTVEAALAAAMQPIGDTEASSSVLDAVTSYGLDGYVSGSLITLVQPGAKVRVLETYTEGFWQPKLTDFFSGK